ncbi:glucose-1-phosphate thymidylyltransferase RfbA [Fusobacterium hominis]|uniref:Glucose-1-phosphate thymidylyltransferase n=1 Tax=Fusobacterium hominis TaxID=2764326 RepID=A0A7G9GVE0_9FUSO|nr:glucose-1-phosphate thymidylyltransferase RfbA [Fusobacterium hominis]QNM14772.1 glucose-1-phosphate thymidylyltransferase RfbA [Fusobacterium hominis]
MKGIILAGGSGTRLYPLTRSISKQILPIYDKPMIYYPMSVLMLAGIKDILIITTLRDIRVFQDLFGNGNSLGMNIEYSVQENPNGIVEAFLIGETFIGNSSVSLILGDNIFFGQSFTILLKRLSELKKGAEIFGYSVKDPTAYGVVEFDKDMNVISIEEKPETPKSKYAIPGLYFYDNTVVEKARKVKPSLRGELEITDLNRMYLEEKTLKVNLLGRGFAWLDTGTHKNLLQASNFIETIQERQGNYVACIEEIAYRNGWIDKEQLLKLAQPLLKTDYGKYLVEISEEI